MVQDTDNVQETTTMQETAKVQDTANVQDTAKVLDTAKVQSIAKMQSIAKVQSIAKMQSIAKVQSDEKVQSIAKVQDAEKGQDTVKEQDTAKVQDSAKVQDTAKVKDKSKVKDTTKVQDAEKGQDTAKVQDTTKVQDIEKGQDTEKVQTEEYGEDTFDLLESAESETTVAEREFELVLEKLRADDSLKYYSDVYTKLYDFYYIKKEDCSEFQKEIDNTQNIYDNYEAKIKDNEEEINNLNLTMNDLQADLAEAKAMADAMHTRELISLDNFEEMKRLVVRLDKELDARKKMVEQEAGPPSADFNKEKEKYEKEIERLEGEVDGVKFRLNIALNYQNDLEDRNNETLDQVISLKEQLEDADHDAIRQKHAMNQLKVEIKELKTQIENRNQYAESALEKLAKAEEVIEQRNSQLKETINKLTLAIEEQEAATVKAKQLKDLYDRTSKDLHKTKAALASITRQLKVSLDDSNKLQMEKNKLIKINKVQVTKYQNLELAKTNIEIERTTLRSQVAMMDREMILSKKQAEADRREIENGTRERNILKLTIQKIEAEAEENLQMMKMQEQLRLQLQHELVDRETKINRQRSMIRQLENDKDRLIEETIALNEKIDTITEEARLLNNAIMDLKKELREEHAKTQKLSVDLDSCRAETNMLRKKHNENQDLIHDLRQKLKMFAYQIELLKESVTTKDILLRSREESLIKCNKKLDVLRSNLQVAAAKLSEAKAEILGMKEEEANLNRIIQEDKVARSKLLKELEGMVNERDVVGAQLVRRNDEISLLYEKMRIVEVTLQRGERQYEQRVEDIRLLRLEILRLRKEKNLLAKGIENMTDLRLEVFNLERELGRERLRVRALEESLMTPVNVHRWRKLQDTNPETLRLIQKMRLMQQKVLNQSEMLILKDRELKETQNLYSAVKQMLAVQPSPDIKETLNNTQRALTQRTTKMRCLIAEVNMREKQVTDMRLELDRVNLDLTGYKRKYYAMKRALDMDEARRLRVSTIVASPSDDLCHC